MTTGNGGIGIGVTDGSKVAPIGGLTADLLDPGSGTSSYVGNDVDTFWDRNIINEDVAGPFSVPSANVGLDLQWVTTGASPVTVGVAGLMSVTAGVVTANVAGAFKSYIAPGTVIPAGSYLWVEGTVSSPSLPIIFDNLDPIVPPSSLPEDVLITPIDISTHFQNGAPPILYSVFSGALPPGLSLAPGTGVITGTPTTPGVSNVVFRGSDNAGNHANSNSVVFNVVVAAALDPYLTGLWAAYSIKKLTTAYAGSALRVRRSSDNTEQDIGFVLGALDTVALLAFVGAGNGFVTKWYDQSGAGNDLAQVTTTKQPQIVDTGAYCGELLYDGVDDELRTTALTTIAPAYTMHFAGRHRVGTNQSLGEVMYSFSAASNRSQAYVNYVIAATITKLLSFHEIPSGSYDVQAVPTVQAAAWAFKHDTTQVSLSTEETIWLNGVQLVSGVGIGSTTTNVLGGGVLISGSDGVNPARLAEQTLLAYSVAQSGATIAAVAAAIKPPYRTQNLDNYLTNLWGLFAIQKLRSAYAGSCMRVRRSSDNAEADIGFDANNQLDEAALLAHCGAGNGFVRTWYDQSGNARDMAQATAANQPRIVNAGVVEKTQNGKTYLSFTLANQQWMATAALTSAVPAITLFSVRAVTSSQNMPITIGNAALNIASQAGLLSSVQGSSVLGQTGAIYSFRNPSLNRTSDGQVLCHRFDRAAASNDLRSRLYSGGLLNPTVNALETGAISGNTAAGACGVGRFDNGSGITYSTGFTNMIAVYEAAVSDANIERIARLIDGGLAP